MGETDEGDEDVHYQISHGDEKYNIGNTVSNIVMTLMVTDGDYTYRGEHRVNIQNCQITTYTPESNVTLYVNST